jgi:hypothetical protein
MAYMIASEEVTYLKDNIPFVWKLIADEKTGKDTFGYDEITKIITRVLTRKYRNHGVQRHLHLMLKNLGWCDFKSWPSHRRSACGFKVVREHESGTYRLYLFGHTADEDLNRLNGVNQQQNAIQATQKARNERRRLRRLGLYKERPKWVAPRALPGASGRLKRHYKNTPITWNMAVAVIARSLQKERTRVHSTFAASLDERKVASLRLRGGFVFRIDVVGHYNGLLDTSGKVFLSTTKDNNHRAYRRLRNALRAITRKERRAENRRKLLQKQRILAYAS